MILVGREGSHIDVDHILKGGDTGNKEGDTATVGPLAGPLQPDGSRGHGPGTVEELPDFDHFSSRDGHHGA